MRSSCKNSRNRLGWALAVVGLLAIGGTFAQHASAADSKKADPQYTWSAEIVSFDKASKMLTLKSRIEDSVEIKGLDRLKKGDAITLTVHPPGGQSSNTWGAGVRNITRGHERSASAEALTLPAEFIKTELNGRYVVYRMPIPATSVAKIAALTPGQWVTAMSPHHSMDPDKAITAIHPYNELS